MANDFVSQLRDPNKIAVRDASGTLGFIDASELQDHLARGGTRATESDIRTQLERDEYSTLPKEAKAALLSTASGLTLGASDYLAEKSGLVPSDELKKLEQYNPKISLAGQVVGNIAPLFFTGGGSAAATAGEAAAEVGAKSLGKRLASDALGLAGDVAKVSPSRLTAQMGAGIEKSILGGIDNPSVLRRIAAGTASQAAEGAAYGLGSTLSANARGDNDLSAQSLAFGIGGGAVLGGALGASIPLMGAGGRWVFTKATEPAAKALQAASQKISDLLAPLKQDFQEGVIDNAVDTVSSLGGAVVGAGVGALAGTAIGGIGTGIATSGPDRPFNEVGGYVGAGVGGIAGMGAGFGLGAGLGAAVRSPGMGRIAANLVSKAYSGVSSFVSGVPYQTLRTATKDFGTAEGIALRKEILSSDKHVQAVAEDMFNSLEKTRSETESLRKQMVSSFTDDTSGRAKDLATGISRADKSVTNEVAVDALELLARIDQKLGKLPDLSHRRFQTPIAGRPLTELTQQQKSAVPQAIHPELNAISDHLYESVKDIREDFTDKLGKYLNSIELPSSYSTAGADTAVGVGQQAIKQGKKALKGLGRVAIGELNALGYLVGGAPLPIGEVLDFLNLNKTITGKLNAAIDSSGLSADQWLTSFAKQHFNLDAKYVGKIRGAMIEAEKRLSGIQDTSTTSEILEKYPRFRKTMDIINQMENDPEVMKDVKAAIPNTPMETVSETLTGQHQRRAELLDYLNNGAMDKYQNHLLLGQKGIPQPQTVRLDRVLHKDESLLNKVLAENKGIALTDLEKSMTSDGQDMLEKAGGWSGVVLKGTSGSQGSAVFLNPAKMTKEDIAGVLQNPEEWLIQKKLPLEEEYRVYVIGDKPIAAVKRFGLKGEGVPYVKNRADKEERWFDPILRMTENVVPAEKEMQGRLNTLATDAANALDSRAVAFDIGKTADGRLHVIEAQTGFGTGNPFLRHKLNGLTAGEASVTHAKEEIGDLVNYAQDHLSNPVFYGKAAEDRSALYKSVYPLDRIKKAMSDRGLLDASGKFDKEKVKNWIMDLDLASSDPDTKLITEYLSRTDNLINTFNTRDLWSHAREPFATDTVGGVAQKVSSPSTDALKAALKDIDPSKIANLKVQRELSRLKKKGGPLYDMIFLAIGAGVGGPKGLMEAMGARALADPLKGIKIMSYMEDFFGAMGNSIQKSIDEGYLHHVKNFEAMKSVSFGIGVGAAAGAAAGAVTPGESWSSGAMKGALAGGVGAAGIAVAGQAIRGAARSVGGMTTKKALSIAQPILSHTVFQDWMGEDHTDLSHLPKGTNRDKVAYQQFASMLGEMIANPTLVSNKVSGATQGLSALLPEVGDKVVETKMQAVSFLYQKLPVGENPSAVEIDRYARYVRTVNKPMSILDDIKHHTVTREAVETIKALYPRVLQMIQHELFPVLMAKDALPYKDKIQLSLLFDSPIDKTLAPAFIQKLQSSNQQKPAQPQGGKAPELPQVGTELQKIAANGIGGK